MASDITASSTPKTPATGRRQAPKRLRHDRESSSSVDDELSYLDLDTGRVLSTKRHQDTVTLSATQFDSLISKLSVLETCCTKLDKLDKLDSIEASVSTLACKLTRLEEKVKENESKVTDIEKCVSFVSDQCDSVNKRLDNTVELEKSVRLAREENAELRRTLEQMKLVNTDLKEDILDIKSRNMRDNLIFTNIPERQAEDTEQVLVDFLSTKLNINNVKIERAHRMKQRTDRNTQGPPAPRPIVAKFSFFKDREAIRKSGRLLANTNYSIREQFPEEIERRRKPLYPLLRQARKNKQRAVMVKDRLFVDGHEVRAPEVEGASARPVPRTHSRESNKL